MKILEAATKIQKRQDKLEDEMQKMVNSMIEMKAKLNEVLQDSSKIEDDLNTLDAGQDESIDDRWQSKEQSRVICRK